MPVRKANWAKYWKGWSSLKTNIRFSRFTFAAFLCFILAFTGVFSAQAQEEELPICADVAGIYLQAERAEPGARLLSSYLHSFTTVTAKPYTKYSRAKLYVFQTIVSTPYAGNAPFNPYFEEVTQVSPYVFTDRRGMTYEFDVNDAGKVTELRIEGVRWVPSGGMTSAFAINTTILLLQLLCLYLVISVSCTAYYIRLHHRRHWISLIATRLNTALTAVLSAAMLSNAVLLIWAVPTLDYAQLKPFFLLNVAYMIVLPALSIGVAATMKKSELDRRQKICYIINIAWAIILFTLLVLWQLYH